MTKRDLFAPFRARYEAERAANGGKPANWRSLDHLAETSEFKETLDREFFDGASELSGFQRREMLKIMGASFALAGLSTACVRRPEEKIVPYAKAPEDVIPGIPNYYATAYDAPNGALGVVVESHEGRPTKIEGNPDHPMSLGAADTHAQASVLDLYDPDRSRTPMKADGGALKASDWAAYDTFAKGHFDGFAATGGAGLAILTDGSGGPTTKRVHKLVQKRFPNAKFYHYEPLAFDNTMAGTEAAFGAGARVHLHTDKARVFLSLDSDFLSSGPEALLHSKGFAKGRSIGSAKEARSMNRLYAVESNFTVTGANSDNRLRLSASEMPAFLGALAGELFGKHGVAWPAELGDAAQKAALLGTLKGKFNANQEKFLPALAKDLAANKGKALIVVGEHLPAGVHAVAQALNVALGGLGKTFSVTTAKAAAKPEVKADDAAAAAAATEAAPAAAAPLSTTSMASLGALHKALTGGSVKTLFMIGTNPVYTAPGQLKFADAVKKAKTVIHAGQTADETAQLAAWHLPLTHYLEAWGDAEAYDGTVSVVQPLIAPLFDARSGLELLSAVAGVSDKPMKLVKDTFAPASEKAWRKALHMGVVAKSDRGSWAGTVNTKAVVDAAKLVKTGAPTADKPEIVVHHSSLLLDGRGANNGWLQEMPDPMSKLCWDNAVLVSPSLGKKMGFKGQVIKNRYVADVVTLEANGASVTLPAFVLPGMPDNSVSVFTGYGREHAGAVAKGVGVDVNPLIAANGDRITIGSMKLESQTAELASTQDHFAVEGNPLGEISQFDQVAPKGLQDVAGLTLKGRDPLREQSISDYEKAPKAADGHGNPVRALQYEYKKDEKTGKLERTDKQIQLTKEWEYGGHQWGMVIDLTKCLGCTACAIACHAENNVPVVGRAQVLVGREMHWLRLDRYFTGSIHDPMSSSQPIACAHCENAPCEPVCPVAATAHDTEGVNTMAYNRCIGTRYCGNNCPFKVRRFNFLDYTASGNVYVDPTKEKRMETLKMQRNPDVTVRYRGVMEKCSYCTQRIQEAKFKAKREGRDSKNLPDGAVTPACVQTCSTDAMVFGNLGDPNSKVSKLRAVDRNYEMLGELNLRTRTTFLAKLRNPNPELV